MTDRVRAENLFLYLHGFASGPSSSKAKLFGEKLRNENAHVLIPDLNHPGFETLTLSSQLKVIEDEIAQSKQVVIIGSSMGGLLATLESLRSQKVVALILMAPGFGILNRWPDLFGAATLADWKSSGALNVYHHGAGKELALGYQFIEDVAQYQTDKFTVSVPTLLFHGRADSTVPISESENFVRDNVELVEFHPLDDDHQLLASLDYIWLHSQKFLKHHSLI